MTGDDYDRALALVLEHQKASTSWLQRQMSVGYNCAARWIERMEAEGAVGRPDHVGRREVLRPPSASMAGSSVDLGEASPWNRNAGIFATPSSARPIAEEPIDPPAPFAVDDHAFGPSVDLFDEFVAQDVADRFGVADREHLIEAVREARELRACGTGEAIDPATAHFMQILERAETLFEQRDALNATIRDLFAFAKAIGFNVKAVRRTIADRAADPESRKAFEADVEVYRHVAGVEGPDFVVALPTPAIPGKPPTKKITARERAYRETLALTHAERGAPQGGMFDG